MAIAADAKIGVEISRVTGPSWETWRFLEGSYRVGGEEDEEPGACQLEEFAPTDFRGQVGSNLDGFIPIVPVH